jgi:hypothetical protein
LGEGRNGHRAAASGALPRRLWLLFLRPITPEQIRALSASIPDVVSARTRIAHDDLGPQHRHLPTQTPADPSQIDPDRTYSLLADAVVERPALTRNAAVAASLLSSAPNRAIERRSRASGRTLVASSTVRDRTSCNRPDRRSSDKCANRHSQSSANLLSLGARTLHSKSDRRAQWQPHDSSPTPVNAVTPLSRKQPLREHSSDDPIQEFAIWHVAADHEFLPTSKSE